MLYFSFYAVPEWYWPIHEQKNGLLVDLALVLDDVLERVAVHELHRDVEHAVLLELLTDEGVGTLIKS